MALALIAPTSVTVTQGEQEQVVFEFRRTGRPEKASFSLVPVPPGLIVTFSPPSTNKSGQVVMLITARPDAPERRYDCKIRAQTNNEMGMTNMALTVRLRVTDESSGANQRLGLHVTADELAIWQTRSVSGPYKSAGDVQTNSPGDWDRIVSNKNSFNTTPAQDRWSGQPGGSKWSYQSNPPALPGNGNRAAGEKLRDAGFYYLLTADTTTRNNVRDELLAQAATAGTDWTDSTRWDVASPYLYGDAWSWEITMWLTKLIYGYDYIRSSIGSTDRTTIDSWFGNAANLFNQNTHNQIVTRFPNRDSDDYTTWGGGYPGSYNIGSSGGSPELTHFSGFTTYNFHEGWNNRASQHIRLVALVGVMLDNSTYKNRAKRWFKEWVRFANYADGTNTQMHRSHTDGAPGPGFQYTGLMIGSMITIADIFARNGDSELYNYSTSLGSPDDDGTPPIFTPNGGPKTVLSITKKYLDYIDHTVTRYHPDHNGEANWIIDSVDDTTGNAWVRDITVAVGNVFWQDSRVTSVYRRQASGAPAYPASPSSFGGGVWGDEWSTYPATLFMFGQMEGLCDPYP